jgi:uncharacterized protein YyaL (SSP411 family)
MSDPIPSGTSKAKHTNRLAQESSPYLLQHAHNPVDWYPWGPEALERARSEDIPILLSVGYAACHWCHVMEHESFESEPIAELMNRHFVCIKVDREERPDIDAIYQRVIQLQGRSGGWPLTVFMTPDQKPFFVGTYFPAQDRYGMPGFPKLLNALADAYQSRREEIDEGTAEIGEALVRVDRHLLGDPRVEATPGALLGAVRQLLRRFDPEHGGIGEAPKFPNPSVLSLVLREWQRTGDEAALAALRTTLDHMAAGGIYDHLGGGFHRYSTDRTWLVPHFEKMLYDNSQLSRLYAEAQAALREAGDGATGIWGEAVARYGRVAEETLDYVAREMTHAGGGFYSTQDADSEGEEGKFFVWHPDELEAVLGERSARLFGLVYDVTDGGNFEGASILHPVLPVADAARQIGVGADEAERMISQARAALFQAREERVHPGLDDKILTGWNGLMIGAAARAGTLLGQPRHVAMARRAADFVLTELQKDGRLLRAHCRGQSKLGGYLDDHALLAAGLMDLWQALELAGDAEGRRYLDASLGLCQTAIELFGDADEGGFFLTAKGAEALIHRPRSTYDEALPSGTSVLTATLLRAHALTGLARYLEPAERTLAAYHHAATQNPFGLAGLLHALADWLGGIRTVVIAGPRDDAATQELLAVLRGRHAPDLLVVTSDAATASAASPAALASLLEGKTVPAGARAAAYLCHRMTCTPPITSAAALATALGSTDR